MKCPFCSAEDTRVIDSRPTDDNASIRRHVSARSAGNVLQPMRKSRHCL